MRNRETETDLGQAWSEVAGLTVKSLAASVGFPVYVSSLPVDLWFRFLEVRKVKKIGQKP